MRSHARVVVIGGGAVGASCLWHLTRAGAGDCLLVEKDELTSGSTWHAAGNIPTFANTWLGMRAGNYAWRLYKGLAQKVDHPVTYRLTGAFWPAQSRSGSPRARPNGTSRPGTRVASATGRRGASRGRGRSSSTVSPRTTVDSVVEPAWTPAIRWCTSRFARPDTAAAGSGSGMSTIADPPRTTASRSSRCRVRHAPSGAAPHPATGP